MIKDIQAKYKKVLSRKIKFQKEIQYWESLQVNRQSLLNRSSPTNFLNQIEIKILDREIESSSYPFDGLRISEEHLKITQDKFKNYFSKSHTNHVNLIAKLIEEIILLDCEILEIQHGINMINDLDANINQIKNNICNLTKTTLPPTPMIKKLVSLKLKILKLAAQIKNDFYTKRDFQKIDILALQIKDTGIVHMQNSPLMILNKIMLQLKEINAELKLQARQVEASKKLRKQQLDEYLFNVL